MIFVTFQLKPPTASAKLLPRILLAGFFKSSCVIFPEFLLVFVSHLASSFAPLLDFITLYHNKNTVPHDGRTIFSWSIIFFVVKHIQL